MLGSLLLALALAPAPAAPPSAAPIEVPALEGVFDGRGRAHGLEARFVDGRLVVTGSVTGPSPFPVGRRAVVVEALAADGTVLARAETAASGKPACAVRRRPVTRRFRAELEGVEGVVRVIVSERRQPLDRG